MGAIPTFRNSASNSTVSGKAPVTPGLLNSTNGKLLAQTGVPSLTFFYPAH